MTPRQVLTRLLSVGLLVPMLAGTAASQSGKPAQPDLVTDPCSLCRFDFGVFGVVRSQTARLNVVETGEVQPGPCRRVELRFLDQQGNTLAQSVECLTPGRAVALILNGGSLEGLRSEIRGQVRYAPIDDTTANRGNLVATTEVVDNSNGRTAFLVPAIQSIVLNDFSIVLAPNSISVTQGNAVVITVLTQVTSGSAQSISLFTSGLPAGLTTSFSPSTVTAGGASTLTVTASACTCTPPGVYVLTITGTGSSGASHSTFLTLTVSAI